MEFERPGVPVIVHLWRFFTGHFMNGVERRHPQNGKVKMQYRNYFWNRYSRPKRAMIRHMIFWFVAISGYGFWKFQTLTEFLLCAIVPFLLWWSFGKVLVIFTMKTTATNSDGVTETYRHLKPTYYRKIQRLRAKRFKLSPPASDILPPDLEKPTLAIIAEDGGDPVTSLRRPLGIDELIASEAKPRERKPRNYKNANKRITG